MAPHRLAEYGSMIGLQLASATKSLSTFSERTIGVTMIRNSGSLALAISAGPPSTSRSPEAMLD